MSRQLGLPHTTVEKDYVIGWILAGVAQCPETADWVFKGGTCIKKCYISDYRFSEDLDFTLPDPKQMTEERLTHALTTASEWVTEQSGIEIIQGTIRVDVYENKRGGVPAQGRLNYRGPLRHRTNCPGLKFDLTADEVIVYAPTQRPILHSYSDLLGMETKIVCYQMDEIFSEKLMALTDRARPRDLYDVVSLFTQKREMLSTESVRQAVDSKCEYRSMSIPQRSVILAHPLKGVLLREWSNMLGHQLVSLDPADRYWNQLPEIFEWLGS